MQRPIETRPPHRGVPLVLALSLAFFAACLWWIAREAEFVVANDRVTSSLDLKRALGATLGRQFAAYIVAALGLHVVFGFVVYGLARLTEAAFPRGIGARRSALIAFWFFLLAGLAMAANTALFPASLFAGEESWWRGSIAAIPRIAIAASLLGAVVLILLFFAMARRQARVRWSLRGTLAAAAAVTVASAGFLWQNTASSGQAGGAAPNILIVGIDSLRNDLTVPRRGDAQMPHIRDFLGQARRFEDATTPLARTFGSWLAILTGRHPVTTNSRYNLMPRRLIREGDTLGDALRVRGYQAIYATDEVRFANFDSSYGFDRMITPPVGFIDFLLGYAGDMPLVNLASVTRVGGVLFPSNHANRAAFATYRPGDFVSRLEREIGVSGPTFLTVHLTLAHWPYSWAGKSRPTEPEAYRIAYGEAVREVDRQFGEVMRVLADKGLLDNAIVVLLSDHGEALGADNDSIIRQTGTSREIWDSLWGHGTSVLSPNQYRVLLAMRAFGRARLPGVERDYDWPVTLEDLRPTLEELALGTAPTNVDGVSLVPYMREPTRAATLAGRIRFTETDFNTVSTLRGHYQESGLVSEAASYYELDAGSGWAQLRESRIRELIARKQRAAVARDSLLAAIPGVGDQGVRLLYLGGPDRVPRFLEDPDAMAGNADAQRLWQALQARFPGELPRDP
jgi:hypothetical protein